MSEMRTRNRTVKLYGTDFCARERVGGTSPAPLLVHEWDVSGQEQTVSEGHPWPPKGVDKGRDIGGSFFNKKETFEVIQPRYVDYRSSTSSTSFYRITGNLHARVLGNAGTRPSYSNTVGSSLDEMNAYGTTAISRTIPTNPAADGSTFLGELMREGLPSLIGTAALKSGGARGLASEFLNYQFGVAPLISETRNIAKAVVESDRILKQLQRDSGKNVRRRFTFDIPVTTSYETIVGTTASAYSPWPLLSGAWWNHNDARFTRTIRTQRKVWFSGCYTYHVELSDRQNSALEEAAKKAKHLLGLDLTIDTLWSLSPWSWLIDWMSNLGDVFHNVSAFAQDGLVLRHGYVMEHTKRTYEHTLVRLRFDSGPYVGTISDRFGVETKQRERATPFGFGLELDGFDLRQWAILGALGITRAPKQF
jgi:hypothetical protein